MSGSSAAVATAAAAEGSVLAQTIFVYNQCPPGFNREGVYVYAVCLCVHALCAYIRAHVRECTCAVCLRPGVSASAFAAAFAAASAAASAAAAASALPLDK